MDQISVSQFQKKTGLDRRNLARTLDRLVNRKIVVKIDNTFITTYGFQKDYSKWKTVVSTAGGLSQQTMRSVVNLDTHKRKTTKEKTLSVKKATDPRVKEFLNHWGESFLQETGRPYVFSFGKDGKLAKDLLLVHYPEILLEAMSAYFRDEQCKRQGFTFGRFKVEITGLLSRKAM